MQLEAITADNTAGFEPREIVGREGTKSVDDDLRLLAITNQNHHFRRIYSVGKMLLYRLEHLKESSFRPFRCIRTNGDCNESAFSTRSVEIGYIIAIESLIVNLG